MKKAETPILAVIGSSNITRNAFGQSAPFNYEADVVMWLDSQVKISRTILNIIKDVDDPHEVIYTTYNPRLPENGGLTIENRLDILLKDIYGLPLKEFKYFNEN